MRIVSIALLFYFVRFSSSQGGPPANNDDCLLNFDSPVYMGSDDESRSLADTSDIEVHRHNETTSYMSGYIEILREIESCTMIEIIVEKTKGARTEVMTTHDICDICAELRPGSNYHKYLRAFEFPECPFGPGRYEITKFMIEDDAFPIKKTNEGRYKVTIKLHKNPSCDCKEKDYIGCMISEFVVEPAEEYD